MEYTCKSVKLGLHYLEAAVAACNGLAGGNDFRVTASDSGHTVARIWYINNS